MGDREPKVRMQVLAKENILGSIFESINKNEKLLEVLYK